MASESSVPKNSTHQGDTSRSDESSGTNGPMNGVTTDIWTYPIEKLYKWAVEYYKSAKDSLQSTYEDRVQLLAYYKQAKYGQYSTDKDSDVGYFDVVGRHRRTKWQNLGDMSQEEVQREFTKLIDHVSNSAFKQNALQRIGAEEEEERRRQAELEARRRAEEEERRRLVEEQRRREEEERRRQEEEQRRLLKEQKMREEAQQKQQQAPMQSKGAPSSSVQTSSNSNSGDGVESTDGPPSPSAPTLWCKPKAANSLRQELGDSGSHVLTVARSEMAIVKVETTTEAAGIFWEFCTEGYDVGFGLSFTKDGSQLEEEILKVVRRECSEDVIAGSHNFTATGTYYLKFDNTYSVFRSKTVYYRVFYCKGNDVQQEEK